MSLSSTSSPHHSCHHSLLHSSCHIPSHKEHTSEGSSIICFNQLAHTPSAQSSDGLGEAPIAAVQCHASLPASQYCNCLAITHGLMPGCQPIYCCQMSDHHQTNQTESAVNSALLKHVNPGDNGHELISPIVKTFERQ